ncbi:MAG: hypothetical protein JXB62_02690 [Pirellulales bacterium]|nr:hypothetical protein [Pirellulales bacterium]
MELRVYCRYELVDRTPEPDKPALLLEGSWPLDTRLHDGRSAAPDRAPSCRSLDEAIDGRFAWIDRRAADGAEGLAAADPPPESAGQPFDLVSAAYLNALELRYYLVKLIRPLAYFSAVEPLGPGDRMELTAVSRRDEDYADVLSQYCRAAGVYCRVRWVEGRRVAPGRFPPNAWWRRGASWLARRLPTAESRRGPLVVLCGNPRLLEPVGRRLLKRGCRLAWLYDRFALKSWLRWRAAGAQQLVCDASLGRENHLRTDPSAELWFRGVNLSVPVGVWLAGRATTHGPRQTRLIEQIDAHFRRTPPDVLVLDEDATPLARAAVAVARCHGARSLVVQHGLPCCRFGFSPLEADRILVWGRASARQLIDWHVPRDRIHVTGSPQHDDWLGALPGGARPDELAEPRQQRPGGPARPPRILLLTTVPPRDGRPDAAALHLTGRTYAEMLRTAFATVAGIDGAELLVKLHPRVSHDPVVRGLRAEFSSLRSRVTRRRPLRACLEGIDCVLSCGSSAGVEATLVGVPVIQLVPPGATGFPPHDRWGLAGTARGEAELRRWLTRVLVEGWRAAPGPHPDAFAHLGTAAAALIADEVVAAVEDFSPVGGRRRSRKVSQADVPQEIGNTSAKR